MDAKSLAITIATGKYSLEDLRMLNKAIRRAYSNLNTDNLYTFQIGDNVYMNTKSGKDAGVVLKIRRKNFEIKDSNGKIWVCPPSLLTLRTE